MYSIYQIIFIVLIILLIVVGLLYHKTENFDTVESAINSSVPLNIFQTWMTSELPPKMAENIEFVKKQNPEFKYYFYDDSQCRRFIADNYDNNVLDAYDRLVPGAYKADLWRYCILYKLGGIYMDIKMRPANNFKLIDLTTHEHYVKDRDSPIFFEKGHLGIYNAFMVNYPRNPLLLDCINTIVNNVNSRHYGYNSLSPTGPGLLGQLYMKNKEKYNLSHLDMYNNTDGVTVVYKNRVALEHYPEYRFEQKRFQTKHYHELYRDKQIYA